MIQKDSQSASSWYRNWRRTGSSPHAKMRTNWDGAPAIDSGAPVAHIQEREPEGCRELQTHSPALACTKDCGEGDRHETEMEIQILRHKMGIQTRKKRRDRVYKTAEPSGR